LKKKTYEKHIHLLAPNLHELFSDLAIWPWDRLVSAMNEGSDSNLEIQSFEQVEKFFRGFVWVGVGHCAKMKCQV
jgi:hypothetical protein